LIAKSFKLPSRLPDDSPTFTILTKRSEKISGYFERASPKAVPFLTCSSKSFEDLGERNGSLFAGSIPEVLCSGKNRLLS